MQYNYVCNEYYSLDLYFWLLRRLAKEIFQVITLVVTIDHSLLQKKNAGKNAGAIVSWSFKRGGSANMYVNDSFYTNVSKRNCFEAPLNFPSSAFTAKYGDY